MNSISQFFQFLFDSYSGYFLLFWLTMVLAVIYVHHPFNHVKNLKSRVEIVLFCFFGLLLIMFAAMRPFGIARDDLGTLHIFDGISPFFSSTTWIQGSRDWGWYFLMSLLKIFVNDFQAILFVSAVTVFIQLLLIFKMSRSPLLALIFFTSIFYQIFDLTTFRAGLAVTFFFVGFVFLVNGYLMIGPLFTIVSGFFHKQALIAPLIFTGPWFRHHFFWLPFLVALPVGLIWLGQFPDLPNILNDVKELTIPDFIVMDGIREYLTVERSSVWRVAHPATYPLLILLIWLARDVYESDLRLYCYSAAALVFAAWFFWGFASLPAPQLRFFDFFAFPLILIVGNCYCDRRRLVAILLVSSIFIIKNNVLHHLLTPFRWSDYC
ncbi:hypothetical protein G6711_07990 [Polynucleobacter paneuropaeus]|nr:hypothetical protein [Polynucleobacter paneuropaeus]